MDAAANKTAGMGGRYMDRRLIWIGGAAALALGGAYLASPLLALKSLEASIKAGDAKTLETLVDFPEVRENLRSQVTAMMAPKAGEDPKMAAFASMLIGGLVETMVTPDGLLKILSSGDLSLKDGDGVKPAASAPARPATPAKVTGMSYLDLSHFRAQLAPEKGESKGMGLVLERRGLFGWKLTRLDLPKEDDAKESPVSIPVVAGPAAPVSDADLQAKLPDAFAAAFPGAPTRSVGKGDEARSLNYEPLQLLKTATGYALLANGKMSEGSHAETGALSISYLRWGPKGFELSGQWLEAASGETFGAPPQTTVRTDLLAGSVVLAKAGGMWGGCAMSFTDVLTLGPNGPKTLASVQTGYETEEMGISAVITPTDGRTGFAANYKGDDVKVPKVTYTVRGDKAVPDIEAGLPTC
jgi:hypothetical protein